MIRRRLSTRQREQLYAAEVEKAQIAERGDYPICALCDLPVEPGQAWDESHQKHKPRWLGGAVDGIAHRRCNRRHNNRHDTPLFAKNERMRKKHLDLVRSSQPMPGGKHDDRYRGVDGIVRMRDR
jgi:hypothetical protein